jgi:hypothetical protein
MLHWFRGADDAASFDDSDTSESESASSESGTESLLTPRSGTFPEQHIPESPAKTLAPQKKVQPLQVSELSYVGTFDLTEPTLKARLLSMLGLSPTSSVEKILQPGGLNKGVWSLHDPSKAGGDLVAKLVSADRLEGERFVALSRELPYLMQDSLVAFPVRLFSCIRTGGAKEFDLIVMPKVRGPMLGDHIGTLWWSNQSAKVMKLIEQAGKCLSDFHYRYDGKQHGDFTPSNIHYDEATDELHFIDLADIGTGKLKGDEEQFVDCLRMLSHAYGAAFLEEGTRNFRSGYAAWCRSLKDLV